MLGKHSTAASKPTAVVLRQQSSLIASKGALAALEKQLADGLITKEVYHRACQLLHCEANSTQIPRG